jgi:hypothetical protein
MISCCSIGSRRLPILAVLAAAVSLAALGTAKDARALPLLSLSASARGLYGAALGDPYLNPYGVGLGVRAGVSLPTSLYLGGAFDYFLGESKGSSISLLQLMGHVGYDVGLGPLTLRPSLGLGLSQKKAEGTNDTSVPPDYISNIAASPGVELLVALGMMSVSAEARYNLVFDADPDAVIVGIGLGFSL